MDILITYLITVNAAAFVLMLADKYKAIKNSWRIPERTLLLVAACGGSLGALVSMQLFRHKTRKPKFSIGIPVFFVIHALVLILIYTKTA